jgi:hypothetical protein
MPCKSSRAAPSVCGLGRTRHREFAMGAGEMSSEAFTAFLQTTLGHAATSCRDGSIAFVCMDWRHMGELLAAGRWRQGDAGGLRRCPHGGGRQPDGRNISAGALTMDFFDPIVRAAKTLRIALQKLQGEHIRAGEAARSMVASHFISEALLVRADLDFVEPIGPFIGAEMSDRLQQRSGPALIFIGRLIKRQTACGLL